MKSFLVLAFLLGASAHATTVDCGTSGPVTACSSTDLPETNILNTGSTGAQPKAAIVINDPTNGAVEVQTDVNSKPLKANVFVSNSGTAFNLNMNLSSKWNADNSSSGGLTSAGDASSTLVVADIIGNLSIDLSGYVGKSGKSAAELCASRILSNSYGQAQIDLFKSRCNDGSVGSPCAPAKVRSACDGQDVQNLNQASGEASGSCPTGFNYLSTNDNAPNPSVVVTKVVPRVLRKCERPSYTTSVRTCKYRLLTCTYNFSTGSRTTNGFAFRNPVGYESYTGIASANLVASTYQPSPCLAFAANGTCMVGLASEAGFRQLGKFTLGLKDQLSTVIPDVNTCPNAKYYYFLDNNATRFEVTDSDGSTTFGAINLTKTLDTYQISQQRVVDAAQSCLPSPYEVDAGVSPAGTVIPADVQFVNSEDSCPGSVSQFAPAYGNLGLTTEHNLTVPYTSAMNTSVTPLMTTAVSDCTKSSCAGVGTGYSTNNYVAQTLSLGAGEKGSSGGVAAIFAYDIVGTQSFNYNHGMNGNNGADNLTVNPVIKNCSSVSGNSTTSPYVMFHQTYWKLFSFTPSSVNYNNSFPVRSQTDAVKIFKKVSPGVQDMIKKSQCSTCP